MATWCIHIKSLPTSSHIHSTCHVSLSLRYPRASPHLQSIRHLSTFQPQLQTSGASLLNVLVRCLFGFLPSMIPCTFGIGFPTEGCLVLVVRVLPTSIFFFSLGSRDWVAEVRARDWHWHSHSSPFNWFSIENPWFGRTLKGLIRTGVILGPLV
jgi:hypothetical protein